jgi:hypothetical protein
MPGGEVSPTHGEAITDLVWIILKVCNMWGNPQFAPTTATNQLYPTVNGWNCYLTG